MEGCFSEPKNPAAVPNVVHMPPVQHDMEKADREGRLTLWFGLYQAKPNAGGAEPFSSHMTHQKTYTGSASISPHAPRMMSVSLISIFLQSSISNLTCSAVDALSTSSSVFSWLNTSSDTGLPRNKYFHLWINYTVHTLHSNASESAYQQTVQNMNPITTEFKSAHQYCSNPRFKYRW